MKIFIFGDSITQGFWDMSGGWVQQLSSVIHSASLENMLNGDGKSYIEVYNLGVSGDSTEGVLKRLKSEVESRRIYSDDEVIIISVGINDSILDSENIVLMDVYQFQETYEKLINEALKLTDRVYCVGLTAVDEKLTNPWKFSSTGKQWGNNRINLFEDTIKQSCERLSVPFIPIHDEFMDLLSRGEDLLADGLHPNNAGHKLIAKAVAENVIKNN
jgi:lysophospholipase L1-like esterase